MSNFKKVLSMAIVFAIMLGLMVPAFAANLADDVIGTEYEEAATVLGALNIMIGDAETSDFRPDDSIKRSEFAKVAVLSLGLEDVAKTSTDVSQFPDVVVDHWAKGYINVAANQKVIIGDDVGTFRPDDTITYAEALTILVRILGYEPAALQSGGYPVGFMVIASQNGITKNVKDLNNANTPINRGTVAQLTYNSLTVKLMEQTGFGNDVNYQVVDKTLLEDVLGVEKLRGQVTATDDTRLGGGSALSEGLIEIDSETYNLGNTNAKAFLGYNVTFYVRVDDNRNDKTLIAITATNGANKAVSIDADDIEDISGIKTANGLVKHWIDKENDDRPETLDIVEDVNVIFNGKTLVTDDINDEVLKIDSGKLVLLDSNKDNKFDIIFVTSFENVVVDDINVKSHRIYDKYSSSRNLELDPDNKNLKFNIVKEGKDIDLKDLKEWDVLSVIKSLDNELINILVSNSSVTGTVTELDDDKFFINGDFYELAKNYTELIKLDDSGAFYLDIVGKIAAVDTTAKAGDNYAYYVDGAKMTGMNPRFEFRLFTNKGKVVILEGAEKVTINEERNANPEDLDKEQLITYELNANGEISRIYTADNSGLNQTPGFMKNIFSKDYANASAVYRAGARTIGSQYIITNDTLVIDVSEDDAEDYAIRNISIFENDNEYDIEIYDATEAKVAGVIVLKSSTGDTNAESPIAIVDKITTTTNDNYVNVHKLYGIYNGEKFEILAANDEVLAELAQGDLIQFRTNAKGEIDKINRLFDASENAITGDLSDDNLDAIYGEVVNRYSNIVTVKVNDEVIPFETSDVNVYMYESAKKLVSIAEAADIEQEGHIFIRTYKSEAKEIVIVK